MNIAQRIATRMLLLDRPVPARSDDELRAEADRNYTWNFTMNVLDGAAFWFGIAFASSATIVPLFVSKITLHPAVFALVAMIAQSSWYLPQLFAAGPTERVDRKKRIVVNLGFILERFPVWFWPLAALLSVTYPIAALFLFLLTYLWHGLGAGFLGPAWQDLIARCFSVNRRGRMFGLTSFIGTGMGTAGALVSSRLLSRYEYPWSFVVVFGVAAAAITLSWLFLAMVREPEQAAQVSDDHKRPVWARAQTIIRQDANFRHFLIYRVTIVAGGMATGFLTVVAIQRWSVPDGVVGYYTAMLLLGQTCGSLLAGILADRLGHKMPLMIGATAQISGFTLALVGSRPSTYYVVFALIGMAVGIHIVSGLLVALEFSAPAQRPTYVGISNTFAGLASAVAPMVGGYLASNSYQLLFGACIVVGSAALVWLIVGVQDPRTAAAQPVAVT